MSEFLAVWNTMGDEPNPNTWITHPPIFVRGRQIIQWKVKHTDITHIIFSHVCF